MKKYLLDDGFFSFAVVRQIFLNVYLMTIMFSAIAKLQFVFSCYFCYIQKTPLMDNKSNVQVVIIDKAINISPTFNLVLGFIVFVSIK